MIRLALGGVLLSIGTALIAVTAVGMIRLPDVYNRMNAVAKAASLGMFCVLAAALLFLPGVRTAVVVGTAALFQWGTAPVGGYILARAAYRSGSPLAPITRHDQLAQRRPGRGTPAADR